MVTRNTHVGVFCGETSIRELHTTRHQGQEVSNGQVYCDKRGMQYTLNSSDDSVNLTLWNDGAPVLFADNDFDSNAKEHIMGKIYYKKKKEFKGVRSYEANEAVRCYRHVHNNVDVHNQFISYGHWDYRTRRKQMRIPTFFGLLR